MDFEKGIPFYNLRICKLKKRVLTNFSEVVQRRSFHRHTQDLFNAVKLAVKDTAQLFLFFYFVFVHFFLVGRIRLKEIIHPKIMTILVSILLSTLVNFMKNMRC